MKGTENGTPGEFFVSLSCHCPRTKKFKNTPGTKSIGAVVIRPQLVLEIEIETEGFKRPISAWPNPAASCQLSGHSRIPGNCAGFGLQSRGRRPMSTPENNRVEFWILGLPQKTNALRVNRNWVWGVVWPCLVICQADFLVRYTHDHKPQAQVDSL